MSRTVVAIHLGSAHGSVLRGVYADGRLEAEECARFDSIPTPVPSGRGPEMRWNILTIWEGIVRGLREAAARGPVDAIGIDGWAIDYAILDRDGRLLGNPASYRAARTAEAIERVHEAIPPQDLYRSNGLQFRPFTTLYQLVADQGSGYMSAAVQGLMVPDLIAYWLCGSRVSEVTNACTSGLVDPTTRSWSEAILGGVAEGLAFDLGGKLPDLVEPGEVLGRVELDGVRLRTSTGERTPVIAVATHDIASAVAGLPVQNDAAGPVGYVLAGTWCPAGIDLPAPVLDEAARRSAFANELGVDGRVCFLKNIMGLWVRQGCIDEWRREGAHMATDAILSVEEEVAEPLRTVFDINDGSLLAPGPMLGRIDQLVREAGEPVPRERGEYLRAIVDSLVVAIRRALREAQMLSGQSLESVYVVGEGSRSMLMCQLIADSTGLPVVAGPGAGAEMGNMAMLLRSIGVAGDDLESMRAISASSIQTVRYEPADDRSSDWDEAESRVFRSGR